MNKRNGVRGIESNSNEPTSSHKGDRCKQERDGLVTSSDESSENSQSEISSIRELISESELSLNENSEKDVESIKKGNLFEERKVSTKAIEELKSDRQTVDTVKSSCKSEEQMCDICYKVIEVQGIIESCTHKFCFNCIKHWSTIENTCPICKRRFNYLKRKIIEKEKLTKKIQPVATDDKETIEIPDVNQGGMPADDTVEELINFLMLARNAQRLTRVGRLLEEIALFHYDNTHRLNERAASNVRNIQGEEINLENFVDFSESFDGEEP